LPLPEPSPLHEATPVRGHTPITYNNPVRGMATPRQGCAAITRCDARCRRTVVPEVSIYCFQHRN
jgi:hypothetical protein